MVELDAGRPGLLEFVEDFHVVLMPWLIMGVVFVREASIWS